MLWYITYSPNIQETEEVVVTSSRSLRLHLSQSEYPSQIIPLDTDKIKLKLKNSVIWLTLYYHLKGTIILLQVTEYKCVPPHQAAASNFTE